MPLLRREVERALRHRVIKDPLYKTFREKTTKLRVLGLRLPVMQEIERNGFSFYEESARHILAIWNHLWRVSETHEALYLPLFYYRRHKAILDPAHWNVMKRWIEQVENWEHSDALCALYSIFYERFPRLVGPTIKRWNRSTNSWKRRASVVSTIYYATPRRKVPPILTFLSLIKPLLADQDPYVQKGAGWQLREAYKLWPSEILAFLERHILELSAITFSYATEKLPTATKARLKKFRRDNCRS